MRLSVAAGFLAASSAYAFSDSSPFVFLSTAKFITSLSDDDQLQSSSEVISAVRDVLKTCPTTKYLVVSQPNLHATDLQGQQGAGSTRAPNLYRALKNDDATGGKVSIAEVMGLLSFDDFSDFITTSCQKVGKTVSVEEQQLPALPSGKNERAEALSTNDDKLGELLEHARQSGSYTLLYFSNPHDSRQYAAEFTDPVQIELKKRHSAETLHVARKDETKDGTEKDKRPLFEKYQFFTPGLFMTFVVLVIVMGILYVGLSAIGSLEVSYGAFEKEMGPAAQKKQM